MKYVSLILSVMLATQLHAQAPEVVNHAEDFLNTLDKNLKASVTFPYNGNERFNWNFVPTSRKGVSLSELNERQRTAGMKLIEVSLSNEGFSKASGILTLEAVLREVEGRAENDPYRDPGKYFFSIFGHPSREGIWGWRLEGHHLSLNFSAVGGVIEASTPTFMGANPATIPSGELKGKQTLKLETELGFELINSMTSSQLATGLFSKVALPEIVSGNSRKAAPLEPRGIYYKDLSPSQKLLLEKLMEVYVGNYQLGFSSKLRKKVRDAGIGNISFAWAGSLVPGAGHYYRIQGPMLLIEFDNTQGNANHIHTTVRDLTNDFAEDILREHYEKEHK